MKYWLRRNRGMRGSITVFVTIILAPSVAVAGLVVDGSRVQLAKAQAAAAGDLALNAGLANFDSVLQDVYGLFAVSQAAEEPAEALKANLFQYFHDTLAVSGFESGAIDSSLSSLFGDSPEVSASLLRMDAVLDDFEAMGVAGSQLAQPDVLQHQIVEFEKYRAPAEAIVGLINQFMGIQKQMSAMEAENEVIEKQLEVNEALEDANKIAKKIWVELGTWPEAKTGGDYGGYMNLLNASGSSPVFANTGGAYMREAYSDAFTKAVNVFKAGGKREALPPLNDPPSSADGLFIGSGSGGTFKNVDPIEVSARWCSETGCTDANSLHDFMILEQTQAKTACDTGNKVNCVRRYRIVIGKLKWLDDHASDPEGIEAAELDKAWELDSSDSDWNLLPIYNDAVAAWNELKQEADTAFKDAHAQIQTDLTMLDHMIQRLDKGGELLDDLLGEVDEIADKNQDFEDSYTDPGTAAELQCGREYVQDHDDIEKAYNRPDVNSLRLKVDDVHGRLVTLKEDIEAAELAGKLLTDITDFAAFKTAPDLDVSAFENTAADASAFGDLFDSAAVTPGVDASTLVNELFYEQLRLQFESAVSDEGLEDELDDEIEKRTEKANERSSFPSAPSSPDPGTSISGAYSELPSSAVIVSEEEEIDSELDSDGHKGFGDVVGNLLGGIGKMIVSLAEGLRDDIYTTYYITSNFTFATQAAEITWNADHGTTDAAFTLREPGHTQTGFELKAENNAFYGSEVEYIIYGRDTPKANVDLAVGTIFLIRFAINAIHALSNKGYDRKSLGIREFTNPAGLLISAATWGVVPAKLAEVVLDIVWAGLETVSDLVRLAEGEGVGLLKKKSDDTEAFDGWRMYPDLNDLVDFLGEFAPDPNPDNQCREVEITEDDEGNVEAEGDDGNSLRGQAAEAALAFPYSRYLQLFLMFGLVGSGEGVLKRTADVIQINVIYNSGDSGSGFATEGERSYKHARGDQFRMVDAFTWIQLDAVVRVQPLFIGGAAYDRTVDLTFVEAEKPVDFGPGQFKFRYSGAVGY
ncbi:MAG: DUF5702 domain-containing protein [Bifidobacteriaceae bacterium]|jgi:ribosomal protein L14E/L6E/L27E|nr:DUF5702 domain-containing protein [Bifidobacteriaceae bacterium]